MSVSEEVVLDQKSQDTLVSRIAEKVKSALTTRDVASNKEDEAIAALVDVIDGQIEERLAKKAAEQATPPPVPPPVTVTPTSPPPEKKKEELKPAANLPPPPAEQAKNINEKLAAIEKKEAPSIPQAQVNPQGFEEMTADMQEAVEEILKNPVPGYSTIFKYMFKKKNSGEQL